ncbi:MAG: M15 family metallopeptidase [Treponema sp.]|nr:M15 family metallopeptidase [Treponema sp.]
MKRFYVFLVALFFCSILFPGSLIFFERTSKDEMQDGTQMQFRPLTAKEEYDIFCEAYPFVEFELEYEYTDEISDWALSVTSYGKTTVFYHCDGLWLPKSELSNRDHYSRVIYNYQGELRDPADFTEEEIQKIRNYGSDENRKNGKVTSKFIFDAIYDSWTQRSTEAHLRRMTLWGKWLNVHRVIGEIVDRVEAKVYELAKSDREVAEFLRTLGSCWGYNWREIRDAPTKSFHSYGIALDILPINSGNKITYWGYEKQKGNADWMMIPLEKRWMPPAAVVKAFEEEGFIWGGTWTVWDNMHFEYHPELLLASKIYDSILN